MNQIPVPIRLCLLLALCLFAGAAGAQVRIGYVDMKRVLDEAPQVAAGRAKLDAEFRARSEDLRAMENRLDELEQRLFRARGGAGSDELQRQVNALRRQVRDTREDLTEAVNIRVNEELAKVEADIHKAIQALGRELGYDLILSSPVEYASEQVDLTDEVLQRLELMFRRQSDTAP